MYVVVFCGCCHDDVFAYISFTLQYKRSTQFPFVDEICDFVVNSQRNLGFLKKAFTDKKDNLLLYVLVLLRQISTSVTCSWNWKMDHYS